MTPSGLFSSFLNIIVIIIIITIIIIFFFIIYFLSTLGSKYPEI